MITEELKEAVGNQRFSFDKDIKPRCIKQVVELMAAGRIKTHFSNGEIQCSSYCSRSVLDTIRVIWNYFPEATLDEIKEAILKVLKDQAILVWCHNVRLMVFKDVQRFTGSIKWERVPPNRISTDYYYRTESYIKDATTNVVTQFLVS